MNLSYGSLEEQLVCEGKLSHSQINEVRRVFNLLDTDKNGILSIQELTQALQNLSKSSITLDEVKNFFSSMDFNRNGSIEWPEFLKVISEWLQIFKDPSQTFDDCEEDVLSPLKRRKFHDKLSLFFKQFKLNFDFSDNNSIQNSEEFEDLENRSDHMNYLGERSFMSHNDKWQHYYEESNLMVDKFKEASQHLETQDTQYIIIGLRKIVEMLNISSIFTTPFERLQISQYLMKLFDFLDNSVIIKIIKYLHESADEELIFESLKIICLFANGPNLINLNKDSIFHPSLMLHKTFLIQNNMIEILLKFIENPPNNNIKNQSLLALGFLMKNSVQIRDMVILENGLNIIFKHYNPDTNIKEMEKLSWILSIIAGVTIKIRLKETKEVKSLIDAFCELLFWRDNIEILVNSLLGLAYLLPFISLSESFSLIKNEETSQISLLNSELVNKLAGDSIFEEDNFKVYNRIMGLLSHNSIAVKRAAIYCLNKLINDDSHCQLLIECKFIGKITDFLVYNSPEIKISALQLIRKTIEKGYTFWVLNDVNLLKNLWNLLFTEEKQEVVMVLLKATSQKITSINKMLMQASFFKALIDILQEFKQYDSLIVEMYGYKDPLYDFNFLGNVFKTLNFLLENALEAMSVDMEFINILLKDLQLSTFEKLQKMLDLLFSDINYNRIDSFMIKTAGPDLGILIQIFLENSIKFFAAIPPTFANEFLKLNTPNTINYILNVAKHFKDNLHKLEEKIKYMQLNQNSLGPHIDLQVKEEDNPSNFKTLSINAHISLVELLLRIEHIFQISPINIFYHQTEFQQRIRIDDDDIWNKVLIKTEQEAMMKKTMTPLIHLLITNPLKKGFRFYEEANAKNSQLFNYPMTNVFMHNMHTNLEKHEVLLQDLKAATKLSFPDIENLYKSFIQVTRQRFQNKTDGSVNFQEFSVIMKNFFNNESFIKEIFTLLDFSKNGLADFRDFVRLIGILKSNNLEDKLRLCFKSYDLNNKGFLDKGDVFKMLQTNLSASGYFYDSEEIQRKVNKIYENIDLYHDGKLTYTAFKEAVSRNFILLNALWLDPNMINLSNFATNYFPKNEYSNYPGDINWDLPSLNLKRYDFGKFI